MFMYTFNLLELKFLKWFEQSKSSQKLLELLKMRRGERSVAPIAHKFFCDTIFVG